jgi:hypothetical protein
MMQCPQCERRLPQGKDRCMYCGSVVSTATDAALPSGTDCHRPRTPENPVAENGAFGTALDISLRACLDKLPSVFRADVEAALRAGPTPPTDLPAVGTAALGDSIDTARLTLACLKQGFDTDRIDYDEYRELVLQALRQFVENLDKKTGLDFVLKGLKSSPLAPYLDDAIYKSLCGQVLAAAVAPVKKESSWNFGIFRKKRK